MARTETTTLPFRLTDADSTVLVRKVFTRMGERLEIEAPRLDRSIRLDAIELESLTWQAAEEMAERAASITDAAASNAGADGEEREDELTVSNEFAHATLHKETDSDGDHLAIEAPKLGYDGRFGVRELEWVATQDHDTFSAFLETPFGPGSDDHH